MIDEKVVYPEDIMNLKVVPWEFVAKELIFNKDSITETDDIVHLYSLSDAQIFFRAQIGGYTLQENKWFALFRTEKFYEGTYLLLPLYRAQTKCFIYVDYQHIRHYSNILKFSRSVVLFELPYLLVDN